jgi:hypothetical protein
MIRMLEAQEQPNWQELIPPDILQSGQMPPPPPDPKLMAVQAKTQADQAKTQGQLQALAVKSEIEKSSKQAQLAMEKQKHDQDLQAKQSQMQLDAAIAVNKQRIFTQEAQAKMVQSHLHAEDNHQQSLRHGEQQNAAKIAAQKQQAKAKPPTKGAKK